MDLRGRIITSFLVLALGVGVNGFPMDDMISKLPGQPNVTFRQFSGYIDVGDGRSAFYYFVEAEKDPMTRPLTVWLVGGPGCSSVGDSFTSVGPFSTTKNARGLIPNKFSWNKVSNLLFVDSPIGAGWTYSNTSSDYINGDDSANKLLVAFMQNWYAKYPSFKSRDLYIAGTSYAGHFISNLANALIDDNKQSKESKFNVKGIVMGNPVLRVKLDGLARYDFYFSKGMINSSLHNQFKENCNLINENNYNTPTNDTDACNRTMAEAERAAFKKLSPGTIFDISRSDCNKEMQDLILGKEVTLMIKGVDMCKPFRVNFYFNLPEVQKAFRGNRTNLSYMWNGRSQTIFQYIKEDTVRDMLPALKNLLQQSVTITIMSGEEDAMIPAIGTLQHLKKLAEELNITLPKEEVWSFKNKEGGLKYAFGDLLTFFTMKGGNHHVTASLPSQTLQIFTNITTK